MNTSAGVPARKVTRHDVAQLAGVSDAVVSYTLNGGAPVAPATAARVLEAVAALGYRPNQAARALRSGSARTLVLVVPEGVDPVFANPFFSEYASLIEAAARERGYALSTTASSFEPEAIAARFHEFASRQVDGVLVLPGAVALDRERLDPAGLPFLELNVSTPVDGIDSLGADLREGARIAVAHLLEHGHTTVGFVGEDDRTEGRYLGWLDACADAGVAPGPLFSASFDRPGGYAAGRGIARDPGRPDALFVASDRTAIGLLRALHESDISVPGEVAIVAFDGSWEGEYAWPPLTSLRQPIERMATSAVDRLLAPKTVPAAHETFSGHLVVRRSCGCP